MSEVSTIVKPGDSALFALIDNPYSEPFPEEAASYLRGTGGTIIRTTLSPHQQERLQQVLEGKA